MPKTVDATEKLQNLVSELQSQREEHVKAIGEIDKTFASLGIDPGKAPKGTRKSKKAVSKKSTRRRKRKRYGQTADDFVLDLLKNGKTLTTSEINDAWKEAGRPGNAGTTLTKLLKNGSVTRENIEGSRGSKYKKA